MSIEPLARSKSLTDLAYDHLKDLILNRTLMPGQVVTETWLSEQLGVSRTPVRQALSRLASEGLMSVDGGRIQVRRITVHEANDVADLRVAIEGHVARSLAERGVTPEAMADFRACAAALAELVDPAGEVRDFGRFMHLNRAFHERLAEETGNALLIEAAGRMMDLIILSGLTTLSTPSRAQAVLIEHAAILDAIEARDAEQAYAAIRAHALGVDKTAFPWLFSPDEA